jgi:hypothetical protein
VEVIARTPEGPPAAATQSATRSMAEAVGLYEERQVRALDRTRRR